MTSKKRSGILEIYSHAEIERAAATVKVDDETFSKAVAVSADELLAKWEKDNPIAPEADSTIKAALSDIQKLAMDAAQTPLLIGQRALTLKLSIGGTMFDSLVRTGVFSAIGASQITRYIEQYKVIEATVKPTTARRCIMTFGERALVVRRFSFKVNGATHYAIGTRPNGGKGETEIKADGFSLSPYFSAALTRFPVPSGNNEQACELWAKQVTKLSDLLRAQSQRKITRTEQKTVLDAVRAYYQQHDAIGIVLLFRRVFVELAKVAGSDVAQMAVSAISYDYDSRAWEHDAAPLDSKPMLPVRQFVNTHTGAAIDAASKLTDAMKAEMKAKPGYVHVPKGAPNKAPATANRALAV